VELGVHVFAGANGIVECRGPLPQTALIAGHTGLNRGDKGFKGVDGGHRGGTFGKAATKWFILAAGTSDGEQA
jgi:hypothetical protein